MRAILVDWLVEGLLLLLLLLLLLSLNSCNLSSGAGELRTEPRDPVHSSEDDRSVPGQEAGSLSPS